MGEGVVTFGLLSRVRYTKPLTNTVFINLKVFFWGYLGLQEKFEARVAPIFSLAVNTLHSDGQLIIPAGWGLFTYQNCIRRGSIPRVKVISILAKTDLRCKTTE